VKRAIYFDGDALLYQKFFGNPHGDPAKAVAFEVRRFVHDAAPDVAIVALDGPSNWRKVDYPDYKAHRPPTPPAVSLGRARLAELLAPHGISVARCDRYEADDTIATLVAREPHAQTIVVSQDKDLQQLVGPNVVVYRPRDRELMDADDVITKWGVPPQCLRTLLAIAGDDSDGLDGVPGFGKAWASRVALPTLEETLAQLGDADISDNKRAVLRQFWARVERNYRLIELRMVPELLNKEAA
jgi:DNA polymerase-1